MLWVWHKQCFSCTFEGFRSYQNFFWRTTSQTFLRTLLRNEEILTFCKEINLKCTSNVFIFVNLTGKGIPKQCDRRGRKLKACSKLSEPVNVVECISSETNLNICPSCASTMSTGFDILFIELLNFQFISLSLQNFNSCQTLIN